MIAPLQTKHGSKPSRRLVTARAMVAAIFLPSSEAPAPPIAAWKAWLFIAWIGLTLVTYAVSMAAPLESLLPFLNPEP
jgi:hypothetical protein